MQPHVATPGSCNLPVIGDLPNFQGFGIDGSEEVSYLTAVKGLFILYQVSSANCVPPVGLAFLTVDPHWDGIDSVMMQVPFVSARTGVVGWQEYKTLL